MKKFYYSSMKFRVSRCCITDVNIEVLAVGFHKIFVIH